jgi:3-oxoacyl-[acyl-carrier protein] reductase
MDRIRLDGMVAVVTGASRGLGRSMACALAAAGAKVLLASPETDLLTQAAEEINARHGAGSALALTTDITARADCERALAECLLHFGALHVLVNNARFHYLTRLPFWEIDAERWQHCVRVNLMGTFLLSHVVAPQMIAQGFGRIVNLSTGLDSMRRKNYSQYGTTKSALEAATLIWAQDLAGTGVTVNSLHPGGMVKTDDDPKRLPSGGGTLIGVDVLDAPIVWLASRHSDGKTGGRYCGLRWDRNLPWDEAAAGALEPEVLRPS